MDKRLQHIQMAVKKHMSSFSNAVVKDMLDMDKVTVKVIGT